MSGGGGAACTNGMAQQQDWHKPRRGKTSKKMKTLAHDGAIIVPQMAPS